MTPNANFVEQVATVFALAPIVPSTSTPTYICLKGYHRMVAQIFVKNATTVTGSAITVKQATAVAGTSEKAVAFTEAYRNIDVAAAWPIAKFTVAANTFTTDSTNSKNLFYSIEITPDMLDLAGGFDCVRIGTGDGTAATVAVAYQLWPAKYMKAGALLLPNPIID